MHRFLITAALAAMAAVIGLSRLHTYHEPMERDITTYAVTAHEMVHGRQLYSQVWENKPPGIHLTYALAELVTGYGYAEIYLLGVAAAIATLIAVFVAARSLGGNACGLWAGAIWTVLSGDMILQANQPNTEVFINVCVIWAIIFLLGARCGIPHLRAVLVGFLLALASVYKQVIIPCAALLALAHVLFPPAGSRRSRCLVQAAVMAAAILLAWGVVVAVFGGGGKFSAFYEALVVFNQYRAGDLNTSFWSAFTAKRLILPLTAMVLLAGAMALWRGRISRRGWGLLAAWWLGTFIAVALPGKFYPHYFQLWLPFLALAGGLAITGMKCLPLPHSRVASFMAGVVVLAALAGFEIPTYRLTPEQWSVNKYGHNLFVESQKLGRQLAGLLKSNESFFNWGAESGLYFDSGRRPPAGIFFNFPLKNPEMAASSAARLLEDLKANPPELVVMSTNYLDDYLAGKNIATQWLLEGYDPVDIPGCCDQFYFFAGAAAALPAAIPHRRSGHLKNPKGRPCVIA